MDSFGRHHDAARLLAIAARQVAGSVRAIRSRYRRKECPAGTGALAQELLNLIQGGLQLAAAAEHTSRTILASDKRRARGKVAMHRRKSASRSSSV